MLAVCSGVLLLVLALVNQTRTSRLRTEAGKASVQAGPIVEQIRAGGETVRGLGMRRAALAPIDQAVGQRLQESVSGSASAVPSRRSVSAMTRSTTARSASLSLAPSSIDSR